RLVDQRLEAAHDDALAGLETPTHLDEFVVAEPGRDLAHLDALACEPEDAAAAAAVRHGAARHDRHGLAPLADQRGLDEHAGPKLLLAVVDLDLGAQGAGALIHGRREPQHLARENTVGPGVIVRARLEADAC